MAATHHSRPRLQGGGRSTEIAAVEHLLDQAADFEVRAPELALVLGERAAALAETAGTEELWVRGEGLAVSARVRLGLRAPTVGRAVAALRAAEETGQTTLAAQLRTDLAICARSVGAPLTGLAALRPVLDAPGFGGVRKAAALSQLVGCLSQFGRKPELDRTLAEADRLCGVDEDLDGDGRLLARSLLRVAVAAHRRRHGDVIGAADAARTGLGFLDQLEDAQHDGGVVRIRLVLQLVCALLDRGDGANALEIAQPLLDEPARAASVAPAGWLRMAVATRVLLPAGSVEAAARMLRDAVHATERHELYALTARLWTELAHVEERLGRYAEAIECLQLSRAAEHVHARARRQAVGLLAGEFGGGGHAEVDLDHVLGSASASATASVSVAPLSVPEPKVVAGREPGAEEAAASGPRETVEAATGGRSRWALAPEPAAERAEPSTGAVRPARPAESAVLEQTRRMDVPGAPRAGEARRHRSDVAAEVLRPGIPAARAEDASEAAGRAAEAVASMPGGRRRADERERSAESVAAASADADPGSDTRVPRKTRHDAEHGSVAARSVLDRLGVSAGAGAGGGRRRAAGSGDPERPESGGRRRAEDDGQETVAPTESGRSTGHDAPGRGLTASASDETTRRDGPRAAFAVREEASSGPAGHDEADSVSAPRQAVGGESSRLGAEAHPGSEGRAATAAEDRAEPRRHLAAAEANREPAGRVESILDFLGRGQTARDSADAESGGTRASHGRGSRPGVESWLSADAEPVSRAEVSPLRKDEPEGKTRGTTEPPPSMPAIDNWLPRLRLPPSLAPWDESGDSETGTTTGTSGTPFTSAPVLRDDDLGEPFGRELSGVPDDDLPEDAGLADLLARALAEHQAGTASAAALVKRLGNQSVSEPRPVNGHGRNGAEPGNGRHRGDR
ncbi:hypothetical protein [Amycolatopsis granulosa]|uniref:hypothetical protein n=1 Tax=Amycolatopsis granulosa TaxID=185684 RepID=UPI00141FC0AD|nr:hypothetical protein [Amycolatopsis granulosa]NIH84800.1 hypothetical protein [Amycolatopsis granulosa]